MSQYFATVGEKTEIRRSSEDKETFISLLQKGVNSKWLK